ncbi:MAG: hypothetical protein KGO94_11420, partial [Alphaproteobacteria bacterium]|nr:hypothetical protein [Alphaproteobacteria bacterium]
AYRSDVVKVVTSESGYYGVILGPYNVKTMQELKKKDANNQLSALPPDALLSRGDKYLKTVWENKPTGIGAVAYSLDKAAVFSSGSLSVKVQAQKQGKENAYTIVSGQDGAGTFHFDIGKDLPADEMASAEEYKGLLYHKAGVAKLVKDAPSKQIVVTAYTGGAHCCTKTWIISRDTDHAAWGMTEGETLDGDGYWFEDVDGDGTLELLSVDNHFLYAFDSYAGSFAPVKIYKLQNGKIDDVSEADAMRHRLVQDLAGMEFEAKARPDLWKENGFLAGWVAAKIRLGQGEDAWNTVTQNMQKDTGFGPEICTTGQDLADCPQDKIQAVPVVKALASFLKDNGYGPLPLAAEALLN